MQSVKKLATMMGLLALCACASNRNTPDNSTANAKVDCSTVRCAACPTGQHPKLTPPDCCRCVPD